MKLFRTSAAIIFSLTSFSAVAASEPPAGAASCSGCHPANAGVQSPVPPLIGKNAAEIVAQMQAFRAGHRRLVWGSALSEDGVMTGQRSSRRTFVTSAAALATSAALHPRPAIAQSAPRVVVVGGGFAGASAARALRRIDPRIAVTLVEAN